VKLYPAALAPLALFLVAACSATSSSNDTQDGATGGKNGTNGSGGAGSSVGGAGGQGVGASAGTGGSATGAGGAGGFGPGTGSGGYQQPTGIGTLTGQVLAPEGTIPIAGALVYLTKKTPPPIPSGVHCDKCVQIDPGTPYALTKADGSFQLPVYSEGDFNIVSQKGTFRRIRPITTTKGVAAVPPALTTLPPRTDTANGDNIPTMAIRVGAWDHIEKSLVKLGIDKDAVHQFVGKFPGQPNPYDPNKLFKDITVLNQYQIVFSPCSDSEGTECKTWSEAETSPTQSNLQQWVQAGGRFYATDYNYEWVRRPWPEYIEWTGQTSQTGSACNKGGSDGQAIVNDPGLKEWLELQGIPSFTIHGSWIGIEKVNTVPSFDADNNPVNVTPTVWVSAGGGKPATVSFERGCGRVLYSTYHTEGDVGGPLLEQERALLYVLLEVGVCMGRIDPPK
jgi:hypothetical protein